MGCHNCKKTCWNCPAAVFKGNVNFRSCGQSKEEIKNQMEKNPDFQLLIECRRRPELGLFEPSITFEQCPEWKETEFGYLLKGMKVMILGIDGYLGWPLALKLAKLGCEVSGVDNYLRRDMVAEKGAMSAIFIPNMTKRIHAAKEHMNVNINFRKLDVRYEYDKLRGFIEEVKPEAIVHYAEIPSAPYSMADYKHALFTQDNNTLGTLGLLYIMKDIVPETSMIKLGSMGEYGFPLSGRPIFEGIFPADATLEWRGKKHSLAGELTPREPLSFYHVGKVQDSYNVYEACKYWGLRSFDIMQGVIYGTYTDETQIDESLKTRLDFDEWFGTAINRFVAQAVLGIPLTIYGKGEQLKGFIGLDDALQCTIRLIASPPEPGEYDVVNQISALYKIKDLAEIVVEVAKEFGINAKIQRIENPRVEPDIHPSEIVSTKLEGEFGLKPRIKLRDEVRRMFKILTHPEIKTRLDTKKHVVLPKTTWQGTKKDLDVLEEYEGGTKKEISTQKQKIIRIDGEGIELSGIEDESNKRTNR